MANLDADILKQLENISFVLGDLNAIRHGEYEPPQGADRDRAEFMASPNDLHDQLGRIVRLLERQNDILFAMGLNASGGDESSWREQID